MGFVSDAMDSLLGTSNTAGAGTGKAVYKYQKTSANQLNDMLNGKTDLTNTAYFKTGLESMQRTLAKQGYTGSGNAMESIRNYGSDYYMNWVNMLNNLAGGSSTTSTVNQQSQSSSSTMSELGTLASIAMMFI